jgi:hypothetical protein
MKALSQIVTVTLTMKHILDEAIVRKLL